MSKSTDQEQWGIFEEGKDGSRKRIGTDTFTSQSQASTAQSEAQKRLQESPGDQPKVIAKRILNG